MKNLIFKISICLFAFLMSYKAFAGDTIYSLPKVAYVEYATGFSKPTDIANAGDGRLFVVEAKGNIKIINANSSIQDCLQKIEIDFKLKLIILAKD